MFDGINFSPGIVTYNVPQYLGQEDILQVSYTENDIDYTIDVGWYRKWFAVVVIKDMDWENPVLEKHCVEPGKLPALVQECAEFVRAALESK
ncbi:hypothetical protein C2I18_25365 [Paenibacillus sp. PK3_47]|uniref:hypothetical protein n=1 Tax=Paenibacillus sp. PK3_47 TaxID=2072642 RepID=UPI00201E33B6|nr:hypothetical protein [Paenibacillus sp. PK3_47]UQZ36574.1 hypothetical protein C2I18_25365 [Paenibacillus sp. PK3_47]